MIRILTVIINITQIVSFVVLGIIGVAGTLFEIIGVGRVE